jgi:hypothetical protein
MLKFLKLVIGLVLLPLASALTLVFMVQLQDGKGFDEIDRNGAWFIGGFVVWLLLFAMFPRPVRTYVLAHELTHALWGIMMGAKVSRLRVSHKGGSVTLNKSNFLITLAPYFFPFYTVLALGLYLLVELFVDTSTYLPFWYALFGLTWSFHLCFTLAALGTRQPDIQEHGRIFSYAVIYCVNIATAALLLNFLTSRPLASLWQSIHRETVDAYRTSALAVQAGSIKLAAEVEKRIK